jgi:Restriction endonuclease EcoRII, N-terminal
VKVIKRLSANDVGITGSHQAGLHIPKNSPLIRLMPRIMLKEVNPRLDLPLLAPSVNRSFIAQFIYYNNSLRGGTRDEFRLTCVRELLKDIGASVGDQLVFDFEDGSEVVISLVKPHEIDDNEPLAWTGSWKVIGDF